TSAKRPMSFYPSDLVRNRDESMRQRIIAEIALYGVGKGVFRVEATDLTCWNRNAQKYVFLVILPNQQKNVKLVSRRTRDTRKPNPKTKNWGELSNLLSICEWGSTLRQFFLFFTFGPPAILRAFVMSEAEQFWTSALILAAIGPLSFWRWSPSSSRRISTAC